MPDKVTTLSYRRVNWRNSNEGNTALSADNLNVMDKGISDAVSSINRLDGEVSQVHQQMLNSKRDLEIVDSNLNDKITSETSRLTGMINNLSADVSTKAEAADINGINSDISAILNRLDSVDTKTIANETAIENIQNTIDNFSPNIDGGEIE
jgi:archaellum component FlaC